MSKERRLLLAHALALTASAIFLFLVFEDGTLDLRIAALFFDPNTLAFPAQHRAFFESFLHHGMKSASYAGGGVALAACWAGWRGHLAWLPRRSALVAAAGMILIPLAIATLKQVTNRHCPWDVIEFGGYAPYLGLLAAAPADLARGICFPAGHAATGLAWLAWAPALRAKAPRAGRAVLAGALLTGLLLGLGRMAQGAHFASHVLWSTWLAWAITLALVMLLRPPLVAPAPAADRREFAPLPGGVSARP